MKYIITSVIEVPKDSPIHQDSSWSTLEAVEDLVYMALYDLDDIKVTYIEVEQDE